MLQKAPYPQPRAGAYDPQALAGGDQAVWAKSGGSGCSSESAAALENRGLPGLRRANQAAPHLPTVARAVPAASMLFHHFGPAKGSA